MRPNSATKRRRGRAAVDRETKLQPIRKAPSLAPLRLAGDAISVVLALYLAYILRFELRVLEITEPLVPVTTDHIIASGVWFAAILVFLIVNRLYDDDTLFAGGGEVSRIGRSVFEAIAVLAVFVFLTQTFAISRAWFLFTVLLTALCLLVWRALSRALTRRMRSSGRWRRPMVILHDGPEANDPVHLADDGEFEVAGHMGAAEFLQVLGSGERPPTVRPGTLVLIRGSSLTEEELWQIVVGAGELGCSTFLQAATRSASRDRMSVREVGGNTIIKVSPPNLTGIKAFEKRSFDIVASAFLLVLLAPLVAGIAVSILFTSGRPILFRQERVGLNGHRFQMIKFRSMKPDAEQAGPSHTMPADPRRTPIGTVLRRLSLDELPQLWNVLVGHMSLVGPRPELTAFAERFTEEFPWYRYRHRIRPGMTGWSQSRGLRGETSIASRVELDNRYIEHWSLTLDLKILIATLREVVVGGNAY